MYHLLNQQNIRSFTDQSKLHTPKAALEKFSGCSAKNGCRKVCVSVCVCVFKNVNCNKNLQCACVFVCVFRTSILVFANGYNSGEKKTRSMSKKSIN